MSTSTATNNLFASAVLPPLRANVSYAEMLVADIPENKFALMPFPNMNHPAFCIGHLAIYPDRVLELVGQTDKIDRRENYTDLFAAGIECSDDTSKYPAKDEITAYYLERHQTVAAALETVSDEIFLNENPAEGRFKDMLPTIGAAVNFLMNNHPMVHLGQISAWRRAVGLPSVM